MLKDWRREPVGDGRRELKADELVDREWLEQRSTKSVFMRKKIVFAVKKCKTVEKSLQMNEKRGQISCCASPLSFIHDWIRQEPSVDTVQVGFS